MANFNMMDEDDFEGIFLTQESRRNLCVSLEEDMEFKSVHNPEYSDISDCEEEKRYERLR